MNREVCVHNVWLHQHCEDCVAESANQPKNASYWKRRCLKTEAQLRDALAENALLTAELEEAEGAVWDLMNLVGEDE